MIREITMESTLREVYAHPVGHDVCRKILLQAGIGEWAVTGRLTGGMSLQTVAGLTGRFLDKAFWKSFLELMNNEADRPEEEIPAEISRRWWKEAVFYQIYPRSFADSDGDGIGDLDGIMEKLDYLKGLGVDALWLSPIYDSPNDDNGYDIRDYYKIMEGYGTMEDFDRLVEEIHARGMRLVMDLVVNHTSDEHMWFREAVRSPHSPYHDYYLFEKNRDGKAPNNWTSFFGRGKYGDAWRYIPENDEWALHLFSKKQMDLNWDNPRLRADVISMVKWWLGRGVDGFRLDVINYISKADGLPEGNESVGKLIGYVGIEHYFYGPRLHDYLRELRVKAFDPYDAFSVGETPGVGMQMAKLLTDENRHELDMIFSFDHLEAPGHSRFEEYRYDLNALKNYYMEWMEKYAGRYWMSLFYENHDNPRMISKVDPDPGVRMVLGKLLGTIQFLLKGTPFVYQGQELGAVNGEFKDISQINDVESLNLYEELCGRMSREEAFSRILAGTRDHARIMMDWQEAAAQKRDRGSIYFYYKKLIALRKRHPALVYGDVEFVHGKKKDIFAWFRKLDGDVWYVECNLSAGRVRRPEWPEDGKAGSQDGMRGCGRDGFRGVLTNTVRRERKWMQPYEVAVYRKR